MNTSIALSSAVALLALSSCGHQHEEHHHPQGTFTTTNPIRRDVEVPRDYVAQIRAIQHIEVRALVGGYLQKTFVGEGQAVRTGEQLFQIMPLLYQAELEKAQAEAQFATIEYQNTEALAKQNVVAPSELALAKAKQAKAKAEVSLAQAHRSLTEIKAPFDGILDRFEVRLGSLVEEGELLTTMSDNSKVWVYFNVTEAEYLKYMSVTHNDAGTPVQLVLADGQMFAEEGLLDTIEADFNNETGNIAFRATFPNPDRLLRHGQTGKIRMSVAYPDAVLVPQKATFEILDRRFVYVVDDEGTAHARRIEIAAEIPHLYIVSAGLKTTDRFLAEGLRRVSDGKPVQTQFVEAAEVFKNLEVAVK